MGSGVRAAAALSNLCPSLELYTYRSTAIGQAFDYLTGMGVIVHCSPRSHDHAVPDKQHARLPEGDLTVILADETGTLRNEQVRAGGAVIDVFRDLGGDRAWQIGLDAGDERGGDHRPGLQDIGRGLFLNTIRTDGLPVGFGIDEGELAVLHGREGRRARPRSR